MNSKGQIFSIDFIIAMSLVVLSVGLLFRTAELIDYSQKTDQLTFELYNAGFKASNQLVGSPIINCKLVDNPAGVSTTFDFLPNCIPKTSNPEYDVSEIPNFLPAGFSYCLEKISGDKFLEDYQYVSCTSSGPPANAGSVFSQTRRIVVFDNSGTPFVSKQNLEDCRKNIGTCYLHDVLLKVMVWKT